jgi:hypothetical protein
LAVFAAETRTRCCTSDADWVALRSVAIEGGVRRGGHTGQRQISRDDTASGAERVVRRVDTGAFRARRSRALVVSADRGHPGWDKR